MAGQIPHSHPSFRKGLKRIIPGAIAGAVVLGMALFFLVPSQIVLLVGTSKPAATVLCARMADGEEWTISYIHSVNRRPVYDDLKVEGQNIRIIRSRFDTFGAGIPETSTPEHPLRFGPDGRLEYTVNRLVPDIAIFVGRVARHVLHLKGREIPFDSLAQPGTALHFSVGRLSYYQLSKGGCLW
jgi:hypothetical protein